MAEIQTVEVTLRPKEGYHFEVDWGIAGVAPGQLDEPPPLGRGAGPNASRLVASAVAHCLSSSLLFCLAKSRAPAESIRAVAHADIERNARGRWRLSRIRVELDPKLPAEYAEQFARCKGLFEDFCIVTESVRHGIPVDVRWGTGTSPPSSA